MKKEVNKINVVEEVSIETEVPVEASKEIKKDEAVVEEPTQKANFNNLKTDLIFGIKSKEVSESEENSRKEKEFRDLQMYKRNNSLLWVRLSGIELSKDELSVVAVADWNGLRVAIPDTLYFMPNYEFAQDYEKMNKKEQAQARYRHMQYQFGARICILIHSLDRKENLDGSIEYGIVGNRVQAMNLLQYFYFDRKNLKEEEKIHDGDILNANVISVSPMYAVVECLGVETRMDRYALSNEMIRDCRDIVKVGDEIKVRVRKLHINTEGENKGVYLTLTTRGVLEATQKISSLIKEKSIYKGKVTSFNNNKNVYTITLPNGVNVSCFKDGNQTIRVTDDVAIRVRKIVDEKFAVGTIISNLTAR